jgi:hypothetical protein
MARAKHIFNFMNKLFHVLYVESDPLIAAEVLKHFNPPKNMPFELIKKLNKKSAAKERYDFLFTYTGDYRSALRSLLDHNFDPLQKQRGLIPFDTILFEVKGRINTPKFSWLDFIAEVSQFGIARLGLTNGFLAFGAQTSESVKDLLMNYGVRKLIKKPFTVEELRQQLVEYLEVLEGSKYLYVEERPDTRQENQEVIRRVVRFVNSKGKATGIHLASLEKNLDQGVVILKNCDDGEVQGDVVIGRLSEEKQNTDISLS